MREYVAPATEEEYLYEVNKLTGQCKKIVYAAYLKTTAYMQLQELSNSFNFEQYMNQDQENNDADQTLNEINQAVKKAQKSVY
jgi:hypothetical protein